MFSGTTFHDICSGDGSLRQVMYDGMDERD